MRDREFEALYAQDKGHYDQANHPEEAPISNSLKSGHFRMDVPEAMFQQPEAAFIMWLDFQLEQFRADILRARKRWL